MHTSSCRSDRCHIGSVRVHRVVLNHRRILAIFFQTESLLSRALANGTRVQWTSASQNVLLHRCNCWLLNVALQRLIAALSHTTVAKEQQSLSVRSFIGSVGATVARHWRLCRERWMVWDFGWLLIVESLIYFRQISFNFPKSKKNQIDNFLITQTFRYTGNQFLNNILCEFQQKWEKTKRQPAG